MDGLEEPKVVVTDVDATITDDDRKIDLDSIRVIRTLGVHGIETILASGNAYPVILYLAKFIGIEAPIVAENGGVVAWERKGIKKVLGDRKVPLAFIEGLTRAHPIRHLVSDDWRESEVVIERNLPFDILFRSTGAAGLKVEDTKFAYHISQIHVKKMAGVEAALRLLDFEPSEALAIGDSGNDVEMGSRCGAGAVVANATREAKESADYVAKNSYGKGFVEIIRRFFPSIQFGIVY